MPAASDYNPTDQAIREAAYSERLGRQATLTRHWAYYSGEHPKPLKVKAGQADSNVIINLVAQHADHTVAFAAPEFPKIQTADSTQERLNAFWRRTGGAGWLANTMLAGLLAGHVFARLIPVAGPGGTLARLVTLNPANVVAFWPSDDFESPLWYEVYFRVGKALHRIDLIAPGVVESARWQLAEWAQTGAKADGSGPGTWERVGAPVVWAYDVPPIYSWQHLPAPGAFYGADELRHIGLNDAVNKVASDIKAILRVHASPKRVAIGIPPSAIKDTAIDSFWAIDGKSPADVRIDSLEMQSDLQSSMQFMHFLADSYMQQARVTVLSGGPDAYKGVTNLGIKAAFMSQIAKTESLHRQYGRGIALLSVGGMAIEGTPIDEPDPVWVAALPESENEKAQTQQVYLGAGIQSKQGAAAAVGIDWQTTQAQIVKEAIESEVLSPSGAPVGVSG